MRRRNHLPTPLNRNPHRTFPQPMRPRPRQPSLTRRKIQLARLMNDINSICELEESLLVWRTAEPDSAVVHVCDMVWWRLSVFDSGIFGVELEHAPIAVEMNGNDGAAFLAVDGWVGGGLFEILVPDSIQALSGEDAACSIGGIRARSFKNEM